MAIWRESTGMTGSLAALAFRLRWRAKDSADTGQRLFRGAGRVDAPPIELPEIVAFLLPRHRRVGVGGVAAARADARQAGGEAGVEEQAVERDAQARRTLLHDTPLVRLREHRVDDGRVAGRDRAAGLAGDGGIDPRRHLGRVGRLREPVVLVL